MGFGRGLDGRKMCERSGRESRRATTQRSAPAAIRTLDTGADLVVALLPPVALLVLLSTSARAWIVATDLRSFADELLYVILEREGIVFPCRVPSVEV
jgi:hypothetical protein